MEHSYCEEDLKESEYLVPLSGEETRPQSPSRNANNYHEPAKKTPITTIDEEQPSTVPRELLQRSATDPLNHPVRQPPSKFGEVRSRQLSKDVKAITFARNEAGPSHDAMESHSKPVGYGISDDNGTQRKRLNFDGSIQTMPSQYSVEKQSDYNSGGTSSQDDEIEPIVIWNITLPMCLSSNPQVCNEYQFLWYKWLLAFCVAEAPYTAELQTAQF
eukprot:scaffold22592_cov129-Cylindrotheca_fusiformis.AAC.29